MWDGARSAIVLGVNYGRTHDPLAILASPRRAAISVYAQGDDYHEADQGAAEGAGPLARSDGSAGELKVFVDTAPLLRKPLAERAGAGLAGQAHQPGQPRVRLLAVPGLDPDDPGLSPRPGDPPPAAPASACLDVCPTNAFPAPYQLDARRCISYLTIELKGPIPHGNQRRLGNRIYGCDDCPGGLSLEQVRQARRASRSWRPARR
jgi:epoxyqueuosine reductase